MFPGSPAELRRHWLRTLRRIKHDTVDVRHHIEGCTVHLNVTTDRQRLRHRDPGEANRRDDAMLTLHVVGRSEHRTSWRTTEDELGIAGVGNGERQVRSTTGDDLELKGRNRAFYVVGQPRRDFRYVNPYDVTHRARR